MRKNVNIREMIKRHEGTGKTKNFRFMAYKCPADKVTVGYGRNLDDKGLSIDEAEYLLSNDIIECRIELQDKILFWHELNHNRQAVLIDMCYNLGIDGLMKFTKFLNALMRHKWIKASEEMLDSKWAKQVKSRAVYLSKLMKEG